MDKSKALTMNNQPGKSTDKQKQCRCGSLDQLRITSKEFPIGLSYLNAKKGLGDGSFSTRGEEGSRRFITRSRKKTFYQRSHWWMMNPMRNDGTGSQRLACRFENGLEGQVIWWEWRDWLTDLGVSVWKCLGGAGNMMQNKVLAHSAWLVGSKMACRGR